MNCREARRRVSPYLDSELGRSETFELAEHLRACPECARRFEAERRAEALMRARLAGETMPAELRARLARHVLTPACFRVLRGWRPLAAAAVALIALGAAALLRPRAAPAPGAQPWIVREFAAMATDEAAFRPTGQPPSLAQAVASVLNAALTFDPGSGAHHAIALVDVSRRTDADGREYYEFRVNCCGRPALLVLAQKQDGRLPAPFEGLHPDGGGRVRDYDGVRVGAREVAAIYAVVVARHPIDELLRGLAPRSG